MRFSKTYGELKALMSWWFWKARVLKSEPMKLHYFGGTIHDIY